MTIMAIETELHNISATRLAKTAESNRAVFCRNVKEYGGWSNLIDDHSSMYYRQRSRWIAKFCCFGFVATGGRF